MTTPYVFKRGNTFELSGLVSVVQHGLSISDLTGWTATVFVKDGVGKLISKPSFFWLDPTIRLVKIRQEPNVTSLWPVGLLYIDIRFVAPNGDIVNTSTATIDVVREITNA
jgi:hypothetical protein